MAIILPTFTTPYLVLYHLFQGSRRDTLWIHWRSLRMTQFVRDRASSHSLSFPSRELLGLNFYWRLVELKISLHCKACFRSQLRIIWFSFISEHPETDWSGRWLIFEYWKSNPSHSWGNAVSDFMLRPQWTHKSFRWCIGSDNMTLLVSWGKQKQPSNIQVIKISPTLTECNTRYCNNPMCIILKLVIVHEAGLSF